MWIKGLHVDGFGTFHDAPLRPISPGLTVLLGSNEAGKSTTLDFLRAMFFGFPRKNAIGRKQRDPLAGGRHGGRLFLMDGKREVTLERRPGPRGGTISLLDAAGTPLPDTELPRLLGSITEAFFCNVYAFGLDELQMAGKDGEQVLAQLYGAGTGAGMALAAAEKLFQKQMDDRFSMGGQKPQINQLLKRFEQLGERIREARSQSGEYGRLQLQQASFQEALNESRNACNALSQRERLLQAVRDHWQDWVEVVEAEELLRELLEPLPGTPHDTEELDRALADLQTSEEACRSLAEQLAAVRVDMAAVALDPALQEHREEIRALARRANEYQAADLRLPVLAAELEQTRQALADCLRQLGPDWTAEHIATCDRSLAVREHIQRATSGLSKAEHGLRDAETNTRGMATEHQQAQEQLAKAEAQQAEAEAGLARLPAEVCDRLRRERDDLVVSSQSLPNLRRERERLLREVEDQVRVVDPTWDAGRLASFDTSAGARRRLQQSRDQLAEATRAATETRHRLEALPELDASGETATSEDDVRQFRTQLRELTRALARREAFAEAAAVATPSAISFWTPVLAVGAIALLIAAFAHWEFLIGLPLLGAIYYSLRRRQPPPTSKSPADPDLAVQTHCAALDLDPEHPDLAAAETRLDDLQAQMQRQGEAAEKRAQSQRANERAEQALTEAEEEWQKHAAPLGFSTQPSPEVVLSILSSIVDGQRRITEAKHLAETIADAEAKLAKAWQPLLDSKLPDSPPDAFSAEALDGLLKRHEEARQALREATVRVEEARTAEQERRGRHAAGQKTVEVAAKALAEQQQAWQDWLAERGFQTTLTPDTAREAMVIVNQAWEHSQALEKLQAETERHRQTCDTIASRTRALLAALDRPLGPGAPLDGAIAALAEASEENDKRQIAFAEQRKQECRTAGALERAEERRTECQGALADFLQEHGAAAAEELRARIGIARQRQEAQMVRDQGLKNLRTALGTTDAGAVREAFTSTDQLVLPAELTRLAGDLAESEEQREEAHKRSAEIQASLKLLAGSDEIARLRQEQETVRAEIDSLAIEWARATVARRLLEEAKRTFERERQPQVLQEASAFFRLLTCERYEGVFSPLDGGRELHALLPDQEFRTPEELSRGTVEQLYLALRFGFLTDSAHKGTALPVVMDEILVNFDPERAAAAARAIGKLAESHQILFFTCHPSTADMLQAEAGASLVEVQGGQFAPA
ncbi:MAG: AAA family ATPase [Victivallales bacterium]|nr:AAA family ATPase [Victivallales bacterium]